MNIYDEKYIIRQATIEDELNIMNFFDKKWKKNHILATSRELLEYEFRENDKLNFMLAIDRESNEIIGIKGFMFCSSDRCGDEIDIWGSMWMVDEDSSTIPFLGVEIDKRIRTLTNCRAVLGNGANPKTAAIIHERIFKSKVVKLSHFYRINPKIGDYRIAKIQDEWLENDTIKANADLKIVLVKKGEEFDNLVSVSEISNYPKKDNWYIKKRFIDYPWYNYFVYVIDNQGEKAVMVTREQRHFGSKILRIVDYVGSAECFSGLYSFFEKELDDNGYEYVDFYEFGIDNECLKQAGFKNRYEGNDIIPNYFAPFEQTNIDIWAHFSRIAGAVVTKADADQDRPNEILPE